MNRRPDEHSAATHCASVLRFREGRAAQEQDELSVEEPLEIRIRGQAVSVTMRTPGHDDELAAGFVLSEGVVGGCGDILSIQPCRANEDGNVLNVVLSPLVHFEMSRLTRHVFASSSCGLCGKATIENIANRFAPVGSSVRVSAETILLLPARMRQAQAAFGRTGGLHAAALFDLEGNLLALREDVGRHNAVDKVIGSSLLQGRFPLDRHILMVSGRSSFEIMQKALAARIPIVAAVSAPSSLAVELAREGNQTLVGFLREGRMNVYSHACRILMPSSVEWCPSQSPGA